MLVEALVRRLRAAGGPGLRSAAARLALRRIDSGADRGILPPPVCGLPDRTNRGGEAGVPGTTG